MNLTILGKATKIFEQIKKLDNEIIEIDKYAMLIANGGAEISLDLGVLDFKKKQEDEAKVVFDEDGGLKIEKMETGVMGIFNSFYGLKPKDETRHYKSELSESAALHILGVLIMEKQSKRQSLIQKLKSFGVSI